MRRFKQRLIVVPAFHHNFMSLAVKVVSLPVTLGCPFIHRVSGLRHTGIGDEIRKSELCFHRG